jgi:hypothetical protein
VIRRDPGRIFRNARSAKLTAHGTSETSRRDPAKRHRSEKADMRLAWRSCRRISSATLGRKAHFCDRHHIARATAALVSHSSTGYRMCGAHLRRFPPELSPANAGLLCVLRSADREHSGRQGYHPTTDGGDGRGGDGGGWLMSHVLSLQLARERAWRLRGGSNGHAFKRRGLPLWNSEITGLDGRRLLERLEAENARLRRSVVELLLQTQALRDGAETLRAYDPARHRRDVP